VVASVTTADDVSSLDSAPAVGLWEWVSGARPVVGAIATSSLMLLACSWFVFSSGVLGAGRDVGSPDPVRIDGTTPQVVGGQAAKRPGAHRRVDVGARRLPARSRASTPGVRQRSEFGPEAGAPAATGPAPASIPAPTPSPSRTTAPGEAKAPVTSPTPPPVVPDDVTSNLPAPLDDLPTVSVPPVTPPVTVPDLHVPVVPTVTTSLGLP
jgi:hypothetical protein